MSTASGAKKQAEACERRAYERKFSKRGDRKNMGAEKRIESDGEIKSVE